MEFLEQVEDVGVMVPIQGALTGNGRIETRELPAQAQMACLVHTGRYEGLAEAFSVMLNWIEANDFVVVGPTREVYLRFGADQDDYTLPDVYLADSDDDFVTELQVPARAVVRLLPLHDEVIGVPAVRDAIIANVNVVDADRLPAE